MTDQTDSKRHDNDSGRPLTWDETKELRKVLEERRRMKWFWGSVFVWGGYISAGALFALAVGHQIVSWFSALSRKVGGP